MTTGAGSQEFAVRLLNQSRKPAINQGIGDKSAAGQKEF